MTWRKRCSFSGGGLYEDQGDQRRTSVAMTVHGSRKHTVMPVCTTSHAVIVAGGFGSGRESIAMLHGAFLMAGQRGLYIRMPCCRGCRAKYQQLAYIHQVSVVNAFNNLYAVYTFYIGRMYTQRSQP
jgi:hypothetical protein